MSLLKKLFGKSSSDKTAHITSEEEFKRSEDELKKSDVDTNAPYLNKRITETKEDVKPANPSLINISNSSNSPIPSDSNAGSNHHGEENDDEDLLKDDLIDDSEEEAKIVAQIVEKLDELKKSSQEKINALEEKINAVSSTDFGSQISIINEKVSKLESSLKEFGSIYEALSAQYNPLIDGFKETDSEIKVPKKVTEKERKEEVKIIPQSIKVDKPVDDATPKNELINTNVEDIKSQDKNVDSTSEKLVQDNQQSLTNTAPQLTEPISKDLISKVESNPNITKEVISNATNDTVPKKEFIAKEVALVPIDLSKENNAIELDSIKNNIENESIGNNTETESIENNNDHEAIVNTQALHSLKKSADKSSLLKNKMIEFMISEKKIHLERLSKNVDEDKRFFTTEGVICNLLDLINVLNNKEYLFNVYVDSQKDDFANWIDHVLGFGDLASKLRSIKDRHEYLLTLLAEI